MRLNTLRLYFILTLFIEIFFQKHLIAKDSLNINIQTGYYLFANSSISLNRYTENIGVGLSFNPFFKIKYLDSLYISIDGGKLHLYDKSQKYSFYNIGVIYNLIDSSFLTLYFGYDIFSNYKLKKLEMIADRYENVSISYSKSYAIKVGGDIKIYDSFYAFFEYKDHNFNNKDFLKLKTYMLGIKYRFNVISIRQLKAI